MKGEAEILAALHGVLVGRLTAINQYFLHARMYRNWGFDAFNKRNYKRAIDEMKHADKIIERILFLEGLPNLQDLEKLMIGENPRECLDCNFQWEMQGIPVLKDAIALCEKKRDYITRELLEEILEEMEEEVDWMEAQVVRIESVGTENYLQAMMREED
ncbi:bacterioferritin [Magnetofaba australis]|uniref:Bacterioferritin n=1 Tax=Magnetofaba australis IT-1 TaxID=1434232 RepID=A0A1Y2K191_9PROT|nr:bacterioferritin [Magnetofaba australis]OSM01801.1 putative bacterioferritin [Magnetofaba australis IT-1]